MTSPDRSEDMDANSVQTRIVVGCDLEETGDNALRQALQLAQGLAGREELHITHVIPGSRDIAGLDDELRARAERLRERTQALCTVPAGQEPFDIEVVLHVRVGRPAEQLHQVAVDVEADLIVVGTRGRARMQELVLGSVAQELMRMAHVSVLVAHPNTLSELTKTARVEPPRPGQQQLHENGLMHRVQIHFSPRVSHISGLL